jgi:predicted Zn-dependent peptidase
VGRIAMSLTVAGSIAASIVFPAIAQHNHGTQSPPAQQAPMPPANPITPSHQMHGNIPVGMKEKMQGMHRETAVPADPASQAFAAANAKVRRIWPSGSRAMPMLISWPA